MKRIILSSAFSIIAIALFSQTILVAPYLQDAEPTSIKIMWESNGGSTHHVNWGISSGNLNQSAIASSTISSGSNLIHQAIITGLSPNTRYYYQVESDAASSNVFDFISPPLKNSEQSFNIVAMSDMQKDGSNPNIFNEVVHDGVIDYFDQEFGNDLATDLGFVMIPGDLVTTGGNYNQWQNDFFAPANPLFAHVPVYPVLGNHENNAGFYFQYFELPDNGTAGFEEHWWYKDYSNVRIIGLNSNSGFRIQAQLDWLETTLDDACADDDIDFVFAQLHHPHLSELWTPGELGYTGSVIDLMETFTTNCNKPSIHFFGHTHGYSRGQSRDHEHLWVNVASAGGAIDNWGEFPNADYAEFNKSIDEYGFVVVNVEAGNAPQFTLRRISRGDENTTIDNEEQDVIVLKRTDAPPSTPTGVFPNGSEVSPDCTTLVASDFSDPTDFHQASHWQVSSLCNDFSNPVIETWKQHENWYDEVDTQANDILSDEEIGGMDPNSSYCWRVRYRDEHLKWSDWSTPLPFTTGSTEFTANLLLNGDGENGINNWTIETGIIESLGPGECNGVNPFSGNQYLAVGGLCDGNETTYSEVYQIIDISSEATHIDNGYVEVLMDGYLSNFGGNDEPTFSIEYLDDMDMVLSSSATLSTLNSSWSRLKSTEPVPVNTRSLKVILTGTRNAGTDNDSYFDDLMVKLDLIPGDNCTQIPLPVELVDFRGQCKDKHALLSWEVSGETDIRHYEIERSADVQHWVTVGSEPAVATSNLDYKTYTHHSWENIEGKANYYRLKIVEMNGTASYSPIVNVECAAEAKISIFPNPVSNDQFTLQLEQNAAEELTIQVSNTFGHSVLRRQWDVKKGTQRISIPTAAWPAGAYTINIISSSWKWGDLLIVQ